MNTLRCRLFAVAMPVMLFARPAQPAEPTPVQLFDEAVAHCGDRVIKSGCAEIEETTEGSTQNVIRSKYRMVIDGDDFSGRIRQDLSGYIAASKNYGPAVTMLRGETTPDGVVLLVTGQRDNQIFVRDQHWTPITFRYFGRLAGRAAKFPEQAMNSLAKFTGSMRLVTTESFEDSQVYVIEISHAAGSKRKAWIDPARGYICPRNELYEGDRLVGKTESSGYFKEAGGGLYFPERHSDTVFDKNTGNLQFKWSYRIDPQTVKLNYTVSDDEFSVEAPSSSRIVDEREGGRTWQATKALPLAVVHGKLDLKEIAGLVPTGPPRPVKTHSGLGNFGTLTRAFIYGLAVALPIAVIVMMIVIRRALKPRAGVGIKTPGSGR